MKLFDPATLRKLEQLALVANQARIGKMKGERRSKKRGTSIEFADYRDYTKGDDLRRVDWNVYARLERPFIKLLEEEEDLAAHFLIDMSASMNWPEEGEFGEKKYVWALRTLVGLAYISLLSGDIVHIAALREGNNITWGPHRGRAYLLPMLKDVEKFTPKGGVDINASLKDYGLRAKRPGLCFILSDLMDERGIREGINVLQGRGFEVTLIHVLSPDEVDPNLTGDLSLVDVETGRSQDVSLNDEMLAEYKKRFLAWTEEIGTFCMQRGIHYVQIDTSMPWEQLILFELRKLGVLR
jgi:uncharacterized protein (DUF58 family)